MCNNPLLSVMRKHLAALFAFLFICLAAQPASAADPSPGGDNSHGLDPTVLVGIAVMLLAAKLCGEIFERMQQPAVLGELLAGIVLGNLTLVGFYRFEILRTDTVIAALAQIGVILLLFEVGLESRLAEMLQGGWASCFCEAAGGVESVFLGCGL